MPRTVRSRQLTEAEKDFERRYSSRSSIPGWKILLLRWMARNDIYPDGYYGDDECLLWEDFHELYQLREEKQEAWLNAQNE